MPISLDSTFEKQIKRNSPIETSALVFFDLTTDIYCHGSDMRYDSKTVYSLLDKWTLKEGKLNFRTGTASPNTATLTFSNRLRFINGTKQRLSDFIMGQNHINQEVTVYWWTDKNTTIAQLPIVFKGVIEERPKYTRQEVTIKLKDSMATKFSMISLTKATVATFGGNLPKENENKPIPMIWGEFRSFIANTGAPSLLNNTIITGLTPCFLVDGALNKYAVASDESKQFSSVFGIWGWDPSISEFVQLDSYTKDNTSAGTFFTKDSNIFTHAQLPDGSVENIIETGAVWSNTNIETHAADLDSSTFAESGAIDSASDLLSFEVKFTTGKLPDGATDSYEIGALYKFNNNGSATRLQFGTTSPGVNEVSIINGTLAVEIFTIGLSVVASALVNLDSDSSTDPTCEIYEVWKEQQYTPTSELQLFAGVLGRKDDGSGTVTGTNDLEIARPPYIIEDLFRNFFSIAGGSINTTAIDAINTEFGDVELQIFLDKDTKTRTFLNRIGLSSRSVYFFDEQDKPSGMIIKDDYDGNDRTEFLFWEDMQGEPEIGTILLKDTINNLTMNYRKRSSDGKFLKSVTQTDSASQTALNHSNPVDIEVFTELDANVTALKQFMADSTAGNDTSGFWTTQRRLLKVTMRDLRHIDWIRGDIIECDNTSFITDNDFKLDNAVWTDVYWIIIEKTISGKTMSFEMLEIGAFQ